MVAKNAFSEPINVEMVPNTLILEARKIMDTLLSLNRHPTWSICFVGMAAQNVTLTIDCWHWLLTAHGTLLCTLLL